jgi:hypothetical protein
MPRRFADEVVGVRTIVMLIVEVGPSEPGAGELTLVTGDT